MPQSRRSTRTCAQGGQRLGVGAIQHFRTLSALPSQAALQSPARPYWLGNNTPAKRTCRRLQCRLPPAYVALLPCRAAGLWCGLQRAAQSGCSSLLDAALHRLSDAALHSLSNAALPCPAPAGCWGLTWRLSMNCTTQ